MYPKASADNATEQASPRGSWGLTPTTIVDHPRGPESTHRPALTGNGYFWP